MQPIATIDIDSAIASLVSQIIEVVNPIKIILFGSYARGDARPDSDIDLLIVMPNGTHRLDTAGILYSVIKGIGKDYDLIVATESDINEYKDKVGPIYGVAIEEGRVLYG